MDKRALIGIGVIVVAIAVSMSFTFQALNTTLDDGARAGNSKLGMVVNSPTSTPDVQEISEIYEQAAAAGIGRSNVYMFWNSIEPEKGEFDWSQSDILMSLNKNNNLQVTLYFSLINGKTLGPFPDWIGKPNLISVDEDQLVNALDAILTRYYIIDSVIIAGRNRLSTLDTTSRTYPSTGSCSKRLRQTQGKTPRCQYWKRIFASWRHEQKSGPYSRGAGCGRFCWIYVFFRSTR